MISLLGNMVRQVRIASCMSADVQACCIWMPYIKSDGEWYGSRFVIHTMLMYRLANKVLQGV